MTLNHVSLQPESTPQDRLCDLPLRNRVATILRELKVDQVYGPMLTWAQSNGEDRFLADQAIRGVIASVHNRRRKRHRAKIGIKKTANQNHPQKSDTLHCVRPLQTRALLDL